MATRGTSAKHFNSEGTPVKDYGAVTRVLKDSPKSLILVK